MIFLFEKRLLFKRGWPIPSLITSDHQKSDGRGGMKTTTTIKKSDKTKKIRKKNRVKKKAQKKEEESHAPTHRHTHTHKMKR